MSNLNFLTMESLLFNGTFTTNGAVLFYTWTLHWVILRLMTPNYSERSVTWRFIQLCNVSDHKEIVNIEQIHWWQFSRTNHIFLVFDQGKLHPFYEFKGSMATLYKDVALQNLGRLKVSLHLCCSFSKITLHILQKKLLIDRVVFV